ncbi:MAG TPA: N-formylglutamate amidohydrolase [Noviherbaspirillum sp.]|nr:N-formylglutamate amidohydrolase [Noviherbaspirillum sp.]
MPARFCLISCEHAGNRIPSRYADFFRGHGALLRSHRGYDIGSLRMARELARALDAPLVISPVSRLLIDLNRSIGQPDLYSELTRDIDPALREEIVNRYYLPFRGKVMTRVAQALDGGASVLHVSSHSFTPEWQGMSREADVGLLFDPGRGPEVSLCERWGAALRRIAPGLTVRMNYPYLGTADGLTTSLRGLHGERYLGIELEINQKHVRAGRHAWAAVRTAVCRALLEAMSTA